MLRSNRPSAAGQERRAMKRNSSPLSFYCCCSATDTTHLRWSCVVRCPFLLLLCCCCCGAPRAAATAAALTTAAAVVLVLLLLLLLLLLCWCSCRAFKCCSCSSWQQRRQRPQKRIEWPLLLLLLPRRCVRVRPAICHTRCSCSSRSNSSSAVNIISLKKIKKQHAPEPTLQTLSHTCNTNTLSMNPDTHRKRDRSI